MSSVQIILFISFVDSMLYGLIVPFTMTLLLKSGVNHTVCGVLGSMRAAYNILSEYIIIATVNKYGYNFTLTFTLAIQCVTFFMLYAGTTPTTILVYRSLYYMSNRTKLLCKEYLYRHEADDRRLFLEGLLYICSIFGLIVGPLISGILLSVDGGIGLIFYIASIISLMSTLSSVYIPDTPGVKLGSNMKLDFLNWFHNFRRITWKKQWSVLIIKFLLVMGYVTYTTKFPMLLNIQFHATSIMIGFVHAYIKASYLISEHLFNEYEYHPNVSASHLPKYLASYFMFILIMCYTMTYEYYYMALGLYVLCEIYIRRKWYSLCLHVRDENNDIDESTYQMEFLSNLITPLLIGLACDYFGYKAVRAVTSFAAGTALILSYCVPKRSQADEAIM